MTSATKAPRTIRITRKWLASMRYRTFERQLLGMLGDGMTPGQIKAKVDEFAARYEGMTDAERRAQAHAEGYQLLVHEGTLRGVS